MAPEYLCELVSIRKSSRKLSQILLQVPVSRLKSYGDCAFSVAAAILWNKLPANIRNASSLENFNPFQKHTCSRSLSQIIFYSVFTDILFGVLLDYKLFVQRLWMAPPSKDALLNIHYYYFYYYYYYYYYYYIDALIQDYIWYKGNAIFTVFFIPPTFPIIIIIIIIWADDTRMIIFPDNSRDIVTHPGGFHITNNQHTKTPKTNHHKQ